ncbi:MAG TPA: cytochrome c [Thermoanaerobaculia bacterium]|jgi:mono/diheme cytochrome c family protein|nr:cytochrome c [Thermoanaerobaculia bacterium]
MRFLAGMITTLVLLLILGGVVVVSGVFDFAASKPPSALEKALAPFALNRSVAKRASNQKNPVAGSPETLSRALGAYREMCVTCHGAPGVDPSEIGEGLNPPAPDLTLAKVQARSDGELFWIVSNGIRMTGMPAFGPTHKEEQIWRMVTFLRHLPELSKDEEKALAAGSEKEEHGHEDEKPDNHGGHEQHDH